MTRTLLASLLLALAPLAAHAADAVPKLDCHQPTPPPKNGPSKAQVDAYNTALPKYRDCIQQYVKARSDDAKKYSALSQDNAKAANDAIEQFNSFVKRVSNR